MLLVQWMNESMNDEGMNEWTNDERIYIAPVKQKSSEALAAE